MNTIVLPQADEEYQDAYQFYCDLNEELGAKFEVAVEDSLVWLAEGQHHQLYRQRPNQYRRYNLSGFPYYIAYFIREDTLLVVAIAHARREPEYWLDRPLP